MNVIVHLNDKQVIIENYFLQTGLKYYEIEVLKKNIILALEV